jgi:hypothetical protein
MAGRRPATAPAPGAPPDARKVLPAPAWPRKALKGDDRQHTVMPNDNNTPARAPS